MNPIPKEVDSQTFQFHTTLHSRKKILCLGDSITEQGQQILFEPSISIGWTAMLSSAYMRRIDVINRGLSGYTSKWVLQMLPHIFEELPVIDLLLIAFGANDASFPNEPKHVPVGEYKSNLRKLYKEFVAQYPKIHIIIITPPPIGNLAERFQHSRSNENTGMYATAAVELGKELHVPVINLWKDMQQATNTWKEKYLHDGLHFTHDGNVFLYEQLQGCIATHFPEYLTLPRQYPDHSIFSS